MHQRQRLYISYTQLGSMCITARTNESICECIHDGKSSKTEQQQQQQRQERKKNEKKRKKIKSGIKQ